MDVIIRVPKDLEDYAEHIENLMTLCVAKLFVNAHKITPTVKEVEEMIRRLREELTELEDQLAENRFKGNALLEIADVVNFALLAYIGLRDEQMKKKGQIDEYSRVAEIHRTNGGYQLVAPGRKVVGDAAS